MCEEWGRYVGSQCDNLTQAWWSLHLLSNPNNTPYLHMYRPCSQAERGYVVRGSLLGAQPPLYPCYHGTSPTSARGAVMWFSSCLGSHKPDNVVWWLGVNWWCGDIGECVWGGVRGEGVCLSITPYSMYPTGWVPLINHNHSITLTHTHTHTHTYNTDRVGDSIAKYSNP